MSLSQKYTIYSCLVQDSGRKEAAFYNEETEGRKCASLLVLGRGSERLALREASEPLSLRLSSSSEDARLASGQGAESRRRAALHE